MKIVTCYKVADFIQKCSFSGSSILKHCLPALTDNGPCKDSLRPLGWNLCIILISLNPYHVSNEMNEDYGSYEDRFTDLAHGNFQKCVVY